MVSYEGSAGKVNEDGTFSVRALLPVQPGALEIMPRNSPWIPDVAVADVVEGALLARMSQGRLVVESLTIEKVMGGEIVGYFSSDFGQKRIVGPTRTGWRGGSFVVGEGSEAGGELRILRAGEGVLRGLIWEHTNNGTERAFRGWVADSGVKKHLRLPGMRVDVDLAAIEGESQLEIVLCAEPMNGWDPPQVSLGRFEAGLAHSLWVPNQVAALRAIGAGGSAYILEEAGRGRYEAKAQNF